MISVVLPVYNQADVIFNTIEDYIDKTSIVPESVEFLLVVNGSKDDSLGVCLTLEDKYPSLVRCFHLKENGWGRAVIFGLKNARGDSLCYTNSARTSGKDLLLFLLYAMGNKDTVIKANRKIRDNWRRRVGSLLYNLEARMLFDLSYWDVNGTPKIFPRKFSNLLNLSQPGDLIDLEFNIFCRQANYPLLEVPIISDQPRKGKSTTNYRSALKMYYGAYQMWKSLRKTTR
jgi:glycosyltransferase involved in cell wall biosynthesis